MTQERLFPGPLSAVYVATRRLVLASGDDVTEEFGKTQVSYGCARKFAWLAPLTKSKALLNLDLWDEKAAPFLRGVIQYRENKFTHQIEVRSPEDVEAVQALGWIEEAVSWGRRQRL